MPGIAIDPTKKSPVARKQLPEQQMGEKEKDRSNERSPDGKETMTGPPPNTQEATHIQVGTTQKKRMEENDPGEMQQHNAETTRSNKR